MIIKFISITLLLIYFTLFASIFFAPEFAVTYFSYYLAYHVIFVFIAGALENYSEKDGSVIDESEDDNFHPYSNLVDGMEDAFLNGNPIVRDYWGF